MASLINASTAGGGGVIVSSDATGNLDLQSGGSTVVAVTSTGVAVTGTLSSSGASTFTGTGKFATTIGVGNATPSASGSGITFPATQSASSDANTLDDYEEGTWTPTDASGASLSITFNNAKYTKIGNLVFVQCSTIVYPATASTAGATIGGLPFVNGAADGGATPIITSSSLANRCLIGASSTQFFFYASTGTGGSINANLTSQTIYSFSSVYRI
jgi:hypothetical protein